MSDITYDHALKEDIQEALRSGNNIHVKIKAIILKALTQRQLDMSNIRRVTEIVSGGINEEANLQSRYMKEKIFDAVSAMDEALSVAAEASKLAIEEAASHVGDYSQHDLNKAAKDLADMESLFLNTLEEAARSGSQLFSDMAADFIYHARQSGTKVGGQVLASLDALGGLTAWGAEKAISNTATATRTLAQIGSGILAGLAESLQFSGRK